MKEEELKEWMRHSNLKIELPDFDENVMNAIRKEQASEKSVWRNIRWSWFFFIVGLAFGLIATNLFADFEFQFFGEKSDIMLLVFEIVVIFILATQFDKLIRFTFRK